MAAVRRRRAGGKDSREECDNCPATRLSGGRIAGLQRSFQRGCRWAMARGRVQEMARRRDGRNGR
eukprot:scaffold13353_cov132-Amphora_coffeaeformis.AAC.1